jgi:hypothetical protein
MFTQGADAVEADAVEKARAFTDKRAETIDKRPHTRPLRMRGRAILHLVPLAGITGQYRLDISAIQRHWPDIRPLYGGATRQQFNLEGLLVQGERNGEHLNGYLQVFRTGAIETVRASLHDKEDGKTVIWGNSLEARIGEAIPHYMEGLKALGVPPPFAIMLTLDGLNGTVIRVGARLNVSGAEPIQYESVVTLPDVMIPDYGATADYTRALRPIFDAIWNMAGKPRAETFDDAGNWRPRE